MRILIAASGSRGDIDPFLAIGRDRFDDAHHLERLGVARKLSSKRYCAGAVATALAEITRSAAIREACDRAKERLAGTDVVAETSDLLIDELALGEVAATGS